MKVTAVETISGDLGHPPFIFVLVHTDEGLTGLGQTADFRTAPIVHDLANRFLLGQDPRQVDPLWSTMFDFAAYHGYGGAEIRAISAIDIALWDILGQATGQPIYALLGGAARQRVRIYNSCSTSPKRSENAEVHKDPVALAGELLDGGITCMKWNVLDAYAQETNGQSITGAQLQEGLAGVRAIAEELGGAMEVMVEGHGQWNLGSAIKIARAMEGLPVYWVEDLVWQDNAGVWQELRHASPVPVAGGERLFTRHQVRSLLELHGLDVLIADPTWSGGISELRKMAAMAEPYGVMFAPHDHSGPVNLWAAAHVCLHLPNVAIAETTRVFYDQRFGYYHELVDGHPIIKDGFMHLPQGPGLGITLKPEVRHRPGVECRRSELS